MESKLPHCYIYTHFEMGDSIICNGLIRHLLTKIDHITLFGKKKLEESMRWMYRDCSDVSLIFFETYEEANAYIQKNNPRPILKYGFEYISHYEHLKLSGLPFDAMYYQLANLPPSLRWDGFHVQRDMEREKAFFNTFGIKENEYIFVHDMYSTGPAFMKSDIFLPSYPIIKPIEGKTENIFDYLYLIENAKEIHCVCSAFKNLIDSMTTIKCPLFFHKNRGSFDKFKLWISSCGLDWKHVEYFK